MNIHTYIIYIIYNCGCMMMVLLNYIYGQEI